MLRAVKAAHAAGKMLQKEVKHDGLHFQITPDQQRPAWYVITYFLNVTQDSRGWITLKATCIFHRSVRTWEMPARGRQDLCLSFIYLHCVVLVLNGALLSTTSHRPL